MYVLLYVVAVICSHASSLPVEEATSVTLSTALAQAEISERRIGRNAVEFGYVCCAPDNLEHLQLFLISRDTGSRKQHLIWQQQLKTTTKSKLLGVKKTFKTTIVCNSSFELLHIAIISYQLPS